MAQGSSLPSALTSGFHVAFGIGAVLVAAAIVGTAAAIRPVVAPQPQADTSRVVEPARVS
jgi:hypothetical protein